MDFTLITVEILKSLSHIAGSYGLGIILLTVIVRLLMWPLSYSQQKSMKKMQELAPKLKMIQTRYKSDPTLMQKKMMEFYKEHQFNPLAGCFPLLLQMPIFIMLYSALMSPQFIETAGNSSFLFINRLDSTIKSHAGVLGDHIFGVEKNDTFSAAKEITVYLDKNVVQKVEIKNPAKAVKIQGNIDPGQPMDLKLNYDEIDMPYDRLDKVKSVEASIANNNTKEVEHIKFDNTKVGLVSKVSTEKVKAVFHYDVFLLVLLFGLTMFFSQKFMTPATGTDNMDSAQKAMQDQMGKFMPIMFTGMFFFFPIPAGVLLYLVVSNVIQVIQTVIINKQLDAEKAKAKNNIVTDDLPNKTKEIKDERKADTENKALIEDKDKKKK